MFATRVVSAETVVPVKPKIANKTICSSAVLDTPARYPRRYHFDSGYSSQHTSPGSPSHKPSTFDLTKAFTKRRRELYSFDDIPIPEATYNRFADLQREWGKLLYQLLRKNVTPIDLVSIRLVVMGESREDARPCVVVQCDKKIAAKVKRFYKREDVRSHYQPLDPSLGFPDLEVLVYPQAPSLRAAISGDRWVEVEDDCIEFAEPMVHGLRVRTIGDDGSAKVATLGGFVQVSWGQSKKVFGLTAGHVFRDVEECVNEKDAEDSQANDDDDNSDEIDEIDDDHGSVVLHFQDNYPGKDSADESEIKSQTAEDEEAVDIESKHDDAKASGKGSKSPPASWSKLGRLFQLSSNSTNAQLPGNQDWALIELEVNSDWFKQLLRSELHERDTPILETSSKPPEAGCGQKLRILCPHDLESTQVSSSSKGSHDSKAQRLSRLGLEASLEDEFSFLMLPSASDFTKTYGLKLSDAARLRSGDCGSWVIDAETSTLYGHIVASDSLGQAYVVPITSIFDDIRVSLNASAVSLVGIQTIRKLASKDDSPVLPRIAEEVGSSLNTHRHLGAFSTTLTSKGCDETNTPSESILYTMFNPFKNTDEGIMCEDYVPGFGELGTSSTEDSAIGLDYDSSQWSWVRKEEAGGESSNSGRFVFNQKKRTPIDLKDLLNPCSPNTSLPPSTTPLSTPYSTAGPSAWERNDSNLSTTPDTHSLMPWDLHFDSGKASSEEKGKISANLWPFASGDGSFTHIPANVPMLLSGPTRQPLIPDPGYSSQFPSEPSSAETTPQENNYHDSQPFIQTPPDSVHAFFHGREGPLRPPFRPRPPAPFGSMPIYTSAKKRLFHESEEEDLTGSPKASARVSKRIAKEYVE